MLSDLIVWAPLLLKVPLIASSRPSASARTCSLSPVTCCVFYDDFSFDAIRLVVAYGLCGEDEGGDFVMGGRVRIDRAMLIRTDGGRIMSQLQTACAVTGWPRRLVEEHGDRARPRAGDAAMSSAAAVESLSARNRSRA
jgi:hypothetical protein